MKENDLLFSKHDTSIILSYKKVEKYKVKSQKSTCVRPAVFVAKMPCNLGVQETGKYSWEYGTEKISTGLLVISSLPS